MKTTKLNPLWYLPALFFVLGLIVTGSLWWLVALGIWVLLGVGATIVVFWDDVDND